MDRTIVFSGHGSHFAGDGYITLPKGCTMHFYTDPNTWVDDAEAGALDVGNTAGATIKQTFTEFKNVPNMSLRSPTGPTLHLQDPRITNPLTWDLLVIPCIDLNSALPNFQIRASSAGQLAQKYWKLADIFRDLDLAIRGNTVTFIWAACRTGKILKAASQWNRDQSIH